jgi:hypothetical protein
VNRDEERMLRDIERSLEHEDPAFARNIRDIGDIGGLERWSNGIVVFGAVVAIAGFVLGSGWGGIGLLILVIGLVLRLAAPVFGPPPPRGDDEPHTRG